MIVEVFNTTYLLMVAFFVTLTVFLCIHLHRRGLDYSKKFLIITYLCAIVLYFVYKGFIITDEAYCQLLEYQKPYFLNELPFQACNIFLFTLPLALYLDNKALKSCIGTFAFFTGTLAILMPSKGMTGESLLTPRIWGYYITHFLVMMETPFLICSGHFTPNHKETLKEVLTFLCLAAFGFIISMILIKTGLNPKANYFYSVHPDGNPVLELFFKILPVKGLYLLPTSILAYGFANIVVIVYRLFSKNSQVK